MQFQPDLVNVRRLEAVIPFTDPYLLSLDGFLPVVLLFQCIHSKPWKLDFSASSLDKTLLVAVVQGR